MKRSPEYPQVYCPELTQVLPYFQGELSPHRAQEMKSHLESCYFCREEWQNLREISQFLQSDFPPQLKRDLTSQIMVQVESHPTSKWHLVFPTLAALFLLFTMWWTSPTPLMITESPRPHQLSQNTTPPALPDRFRYAYSLQKGLAWLAQVQEENGSWNPAKWGGQSQYTVGLTGLVAYTFLQASPPVVEKYRKNIDRAVSYLLRNRRGSSSELNQLGRVHSYNQSMATLALFQAYQNQISHRQLSPQLARAISRDTSSSHLFPRGMARSESAHYMTTTPHQTNLPSTPSTGLVKKGVNYYSMYHRLQSQPQSANDLPNQLVQGQRTDATCRGSWEPSDHWSQAGGRVYATAMATLTLREIVCQ